MAYQSGAEISPVILAANVAGLRAAASTIFRAGALASIVAIYAGSGTPVFWWDPTSVATDDGALIIKPNDIGGGSPGRWLAMPLRGGTPDADPNTIMSRDDNADTAVRYLAAEAVIGDPSLELYASDNVLVEGVASDALVQVKTGASGSIRMQVGTFVVDLTAEDDWLCMRPINDENGIRIEVLEASRELLLMGAGSVGITGNIQLSALSTTTPIRMRAREIQHTDAGTASKRIERHCFASVGTSGAVQSVLGSHVVDASGGRVKRTITARHNTTGDRASWVYHYDARLVVGAAAFSNGNQGYGVARAIKDTTMMNAQCELELSGTAVRALGTGFTGADITWFDELEGVV